MRNYSVCIDMLALLYSKLSINADMVHINLINQYNEVLKRKMNVNGHEYNVVRTESYDDPQCVFNRLNDTNGNCYSVLNSKYIDSENLVEIWKKHLMYQNYYLIVTSVNPELLSILGIEEYEKIIDFFKKVNFELPSKFFSEKIKEKNIKNKTIEIKDSLYYEDLMYEIESLAGFDVNGDFELWKRIEERKKDIREDKPVVGVSLQCYSISPFQEELFEMVKYISKKVDTPFTSLKQISKYPDITIEVLNILAKKKQENDLLIQLMSVIKDMELENEFSLGQSREQCVCLNKNENIWEVYLVERGIVFDKSAHEELFDACIEVIRQLSDSKELFEEQRENFSKVKKLTNPNK